MLANLKDKALSIFRREQEEAQSRRVEAIVSDLATKDRLADQQARLRELEAESLGARQLIEGEAQEIAKIIAALIPRFEKLEAQARGGRVANFEARSLAQELGVTRRAQMLSASEIVSRAIGKRFDDAGKRELALRLDDWLKPSFAQIVRASEDD